MTTRITASALALSALLFLSTADTPAPAYERALRTVGDSHYQVRFAGQHVGELHNSLTVLRNGDVRIASDFTTRLSPGTPQRQRKRMDFAASPPHGLKLASFNVTDDSGEQSTQLSWRHGPLTATRNSHQIDRVEGFNFTLADYLAVELWLGTKPSIGTELIAGDIDFHALSLTPQVWKLLEETETGYLLGTGALRNATTVQMDENLQPQRFQILDALDVSRVPAGSTLPDLAAGMHSRYFHVPTDRALPHHTELSALTLQTHAPPALAAAWPLVDADGRLHSPVALPDLDPDRALAATEDYPTADPALRSVAAELHRRWPEPATFARELVGWVHSQLRYEHGAPTTPPPLTLERQSGDCTEFAYLYATLARINGIPARTVSGLAYSPEPEPGFLVHAWNVVWVDGQWLAVDPTWNQTRIDASHLPFPDDSSAGLRILAQLPQTRFSVVETDYR